MTDKKEQTLRLLRSTGMMKSFSLMFENYRSLSEKEDEAGFYTKIENFMIEDGIVEKIADVYGELFTEEEISESIKYHETSTGKKFVDLLPVLNGQIQPIAIEMMTRFISQQIEAEGLENAE